MAAKKPAAAKPAAKAKATYDAAILASVVTATNAGSFVYVEPKMAQAMVDAGVAEVNTAMTDANGAVATRATQEGVSANGGAPAATGDVASRPVAPKASSFVIEDNVPVPATRRGGRTSGLYPFDGLAVNQSFFIPATEERPNVAKSMASTISSANKRYKTTAADGTVTVERRFIVRTKRSKTAPQALASGVWSNLAGASPVSAR